MARFSLHLNDAGITLLDSEKIRYSEPGMMLFENDQLASGATAFLNSRIHPRRIQHRFWSTLSTEPLSDRHFEHLSAADLASSQLEEIWQRSATSGDTLVLAVPPFLDKDHLGLLLGIATALDIRVVAMVDAAVAATRREYANAVPIHIDIGLHTTSMTRLAQPGLSQVENAEVLHDCGLFELYDTWLNSIAEEFVGQSRFDPLHTAETEQMLANQLASWLGQAAARPSVAMEIRHNDLEHRAEVESLQLIGAVAPFYQRIASQLRTLIRAGETPALQVTDRVSRLPGLSDLLKARVGGEVFALEAGATARGALARTPESEADQGGVSLLRQLPWDQTPFTVEAQVAAPREGTTPTHLLFGHRAFRIASDPLVIGTQADDSGERALTLDAEMPGISRRHCSLVLREGRCVVEDVSRYGTFLNGHRIDGSTVLQVGDTLRVGSPGFELTLIATEEDSGA